MEKVPISVVVLAKNEENNIRPCLESVAGWVDEIVVLDDESTDRTVEIAREYTGIIHVKRMDNEGANRNWACEKAKSEWVLSLDADERVSPELKDEIIKVLPNAENVAFSIPRRNYIGDYWLKYGGQYPASQLKLFRKNKFRYEEVEVHPRAFIDGLEGKLAKDIIHKSFRDFGHFLEKINHQSTLEAKKWIRVGQKMPRGRIVRRTIDRFLRTYLRKRGFKDGFVGFMVAFYASLYQIMSYAKYWEMTRGKEGKDKGVLADTMTNDK